MTSHLHQALICAAALFAGELQAAFPTLALKPVVLNQIHSPTTITHAPDGSGRLFVCDQPGKIYVIEGGMMIPTPFLNIANPSNAAPNNGPGPVVGVGTGYSEQGLLGLAFHPGYANPASPGYRKFYVNYVKLRDAGTDPAPPQVGDPATWVTVIDEFEVSATHPNIANPSSQRRVLAFTQPQTNHNGGQLEFGPDGMLYIGTGDGGGSNDNAAGHTGRETSTTACLGNAQDKTRFLGKILRINPVDPDAAGPLSYSIPVDNPFVGAGGGVKEEIFAYGLRNPWRFSFDQRPGGTNRLFCGDVGQGRIEEVNLIVSGGNYGWRYKEGLELPTFSSSAASNPMPHPGGTLIDPIATYAHTGIVTIPALPQLGLSVTGGYVYRGTAIPALQGKYVFGDYGATAGASDGRIMGLEETSAGSGTFNFTQALPLLGLANPVVGKRLLCLGEDGNGELYLGMKSSAGVLQLDGTVPAGIIYKIVATNPGTATLSPIQDNTVFSESGSLSDARGFLYAGRTGVVSGSSDLRRALVSFQVAGLDPGAVIQTASLTMQINKVGPSATGTTLRLFKVSEAWGEGSSINPSGGNGDAATPSDATWTHRLFGTSTWTTPGGTFQPTETANTTANVGSITWTSSSPMVSDVQSWFNDPDHNFGWLIKGDEATDGSACRFDSKDFGTSGPELTVSFLAPPPPTRFENWLAAWYPTNLPGQYVDPNGDDDGDGIKNQIEYAIGLGPLNFDTSDDFSVTSTAGSAGSTDVTLTFRRDMDAADLTSRLEISNDLLHWTTIAETVSGATPSGQNGGVIVSDDNLDGSINLVTVSVNLPSGSGARFFTRMEVLRN